MAEPNKTRLVQTLELNESDLPLLEKVTVGEVVYVPFTDFKEVSDNLVEAKKLLTTTLASNRVTSALKTAITKFLRAPA